LFVGETLTADGDALLAKDRGNSGPGDAVATTDLLSGLTGFVPVHDVGDVLGGQEAL
jgi:hypothetical protein